METKNSNWEELDSWAVGGDNRLFSLYSSLSDWRKTEAVSIAAVSVHSGNLNYVPDDVLSPDICRTTLTAKDADLDILSKIPYLEVQKEAIKMFLEVGNKPFIIYSFAGISDAQMARDAVKGDAYCLQFVPDKLMTSDLCKTAFRSPNADEKVLRFVNERFPKLQTEIAKDEKPQHHAERKLKM
ncbi:MAG: hypothetical protein EZS26_003104 [Candidatus Ordinivivax streblomastigis]|uniref:Uncharacterized protein n=1 Tax=Candidatus Ordinivivax streblomastigis TaxID=2540710 RepID=A0A5M8NYI2_9BACT|nr:MAG: hypothetical protein EZS26_003104 [Candidatus Ordinivivax streblomastigis]